MLIEMAERRMLPDKLVRMGIRRLLRDRLREERARLTFGNRSELVRDLFATGPIAVETGAANDQHYEVPAGFYEQMLGPHLKYSSCHWDEGCADLAAAEASMLGTTCERAELDDGQQILELGCGWGSLTLWMARHYPGAKIVAVSNSHSQQDFIRASCNDRQLKNVDVRVHNVANLQLDERFDRVVSVEMFEHMRNWQLLLSNVSNWLEANGKCFLHTFCHRELFYPFVVEGEADWMARHFFSGGVMPSFDLLSQLDVPLVLEQQWQVNGMHYAKTCRAWLENLDDASEQIIRLFAKSLGEQQAKRQLARWRIFVLACEELFAFNGGEEWFVSHARLRRD
ncbi:MAG: cyclopropane-fatty-acyl-phospholipid synthase family protein [Planctomycetota bacterium]